MPYSAKAHRAFAARCHGKVQSASLKKIPKGTACKMASEGVKKKKG